MSRLVAAGCLCVLLVVPCALAAFGLLVVVAAAAGLLRGGGM